MFDSIFDGDTGVTLTPEDEIVAITTSILMGIWLSVAYTAMNKSKLLSKDFNITLVALPAIIAVIVALVGNNVARAFSIAGIFSIIRFRSMRHDPMELTFVLLSMAIGLGCGMGFIGYAVIFGIALSLTVIIARIVFRNKGQKKLLRIDIKDGVGYNHTFDNIFQRYTSAFELVQVKSNSDESCNRLLYQMLLTTEADESQFLNDLRTSSLDNSLDNVTFTLTNLTRNSPND